ncbi:hypothetical protein ACFQMF_01425 [Halorubrum rutilum]|uniref:Uncharacterized protein n=1 Tax=Halorubrum rutilum TaxID=1364933 RepID=A0ABD6AGS3_9EURY|nr:hypothetical protein [Halorubrum rutilum]
MPNGHRPLASITAGALVLVWLAITLSLTFEGIEAVAPPYYGIFTALVFLLVGRLWGIERELMEAAADSLPISIDLSQEDTQDED